MRRACRRAEQSGAQAVADRPEDRERHRSAGDRQQTIAGAVQHRKGDHRAGSEQRQDCRTERMQDRREPRRHQRMDEPKRAEFDQARADLRGPDQGRGGNGDRRACARDLEQSRQMRRHGARHKRGCGKDKGEDRHRPARRRRRFAFGFRSQRRRCRRDQQAIERQAHDDMQRRPDKARLAPAVMRFEKSRERPSDRAGKTGDQRNAGDRPAGRAAIEAGQCREGRFIEAHRHADAEQEPGERQQENLMRKTEQHEPGRQDHIRDGQHAAAAMLINGAADGRTENGRQQQRTRENAEDDRPRYAGSIRDRIGEDRRQIIARGPGQGLRGPERRHDDGAVHRAASPIRSSTMTQSRHCPSSFPWRR